MENCKLCFNINIGGIKRKSTIVHSNKCIAINPSSKRPSIGYIDTNPKKNCDIFDYSCINFIDPKLKMFTNTIFSRMY